MWRRSASGARINDLHAYLCAFRSKPPVSANRVTQTRSPSPPSLESGYPKSALKISSRASAERSRAEPSRALASRRLRIFFFSLHIPPPIFPRCPEWRIHPFRWHTRAYTVSISVYIYIYTRARDRPIDWRSPFFPEGGREGEDIGKSGIKRTMVTKREKIYPPRSSTSLDDLHSVELERASARARMRFAVGGCVCVLYRSATRT